MLSYHPPLKERIIGQDLHSKILLVIKKQTATFRYKRWNNETIEIAIAAVLKGEYH